MSIYKENIDIQETLKIDENNENSMDADDQTTSKGLFIKPSQNVPGRTEDVTDMVLVANDSLGKVVWTPVEDVPFGSSEGYASVDGGTATVDQPRGLIEWDINVSGGGGTDTFTLNYSDITTNSLIFLTINNDIANYLTMYSFPPSSGIVTIKVFNESIGAFFGRVDLNYFIIP